METSNENTVVYDFAAGPRQAATGPVPGGRWNVFVQDIVPQVGKKSGRAYDMIVFEVTDGDYTQAADPAYIGSRIWCRKPWMMGELLLATGYAMKDGEKVMAVNAAGAPKPGPVVVPRSNLLDFPLVVDLEATVYEGKAGNEVMAIYMAENVPAPPAPLDDLPF